MTLNLYVSLLNRKSEDSLLSTLSKRDKTKKHIIIAPDRCTLDIEKRLFDYTSQDSLIDLDVLTFSRLANKFLTTNNFNEKILNKNSAVAIIKKILIDNKDKLVNFKKAINFNGFSSELYNTICLFKSCDINPSDIDEQTSFNALNLKLKDIKFVYQKYEDFLQNNYTDSFNRLSLFASKISSESYKDTNFYFVGFEDFTKQQLQIIRALIKYSNEVSIATTWSKSNSKVENSNIFLNSIFYDIQDLANSLNVSPNIIKSGEIQNDLETNLYSLSLDKRFKEEKVKSDYNQGYSIYSYANINDEVLRTVADIKFKIINEGLKFKDFSIIVPSFAEYKNLLAKEFEKFDMPYYFDMADSLNENYIVRQMLNLLKIISSDFDKYDVLSFLKSDFSGEDSLKVYDYERFINRYGIMGNGLLDNRNLKFPLSILDTLDKYREKCKQEQMVQDFIVNIKDLLSELDLDTKLTAFQEKCLEDKDIPLYRKNMQVISKLTKAFEELNLVFANEFVTISEFVDLFEAYLADSTLVLPPLALDSIFVGDFEKSYIPNNRFVYILGANEGVMPSYNLDTGIITDKDISKLSNKNKLNPTVAVINKRKRFKVFENLFIGENVIVSYKSCNASGEDCYPAIWVDQIAKILNLNILNGTKVCDFISNSQYSIDQRNFVFNNFNQNTAKDNFLFMVKQWKSFSNNKNFVKLTSTLNSALAKFSGYPQFILKNRRYVNKVENLKNANLVYFKNSKVSISEIERFYHCPYQHFVDYGLKLEENKLSEITAMDNGNILHEFLRLIMPKVVKHYKEEEFEKNSRKIATETLEYIIKNNSNYDYVQKNEALNYFVESLKDEATRILKALIYQQKHSKFITDSKLLEYAFEKEGEKIEFYSKGRKITIKGFIDRVDICDNEFRIIDYKTGKSSSTFDDFSDVANGKKIQLFIYLMAYEKISNKKPVGVFYMPILNSFSKENSLELYKLQGVMEESNVTLLNFDDQLSEPSYVSNIVNAKTSKDGNIVFNNKMINESDFHKISEYSFDLLKNACDNILDGVIKPYPLGKDLNSLQCKFCSYKAICGFSELYGDNYKEELKVSDMQKFNEIIEGDADDK